MEENYLSGIIELYENGNIEAFKRELNILSKLEMANLIIEWTLRGKANTDVVCLIHRYLYND